MHGRVAKVSEGGWVVRAYAYETPATSSNCSSVGRVPLLLLLLLLTSWLSSMGNGREAACDTALTD
jgi:hypothetical protein